MNSPSYIKLILIIFKYKINLYHSFIIGNFIDIVVPLFSSLSICNTPL